MFFHSQSSRFKILIVPDCNENSTNDISGRNTFKWCFLMVSELCFPLIRIRRIQWNGFHWSDHVTSDDQHLVKYGQK